MILKIKNISNNPLPEYSTESSAGFDLRAFLDNDLILKPFERTLIPTGLFMEIQEGYEGQIRPRSGLAIKHGISLVNSPGTIDADYRGEIKIIIINLSKEDFIIKSGDRVAQMVISKYEKVQIEKVDSLSSSKRGIGGFGSTGI